MVSKKIKVSEKTIDNLTYKADFWSSIDTEEVMRIALGATAAKAIINSLQETNSDIINELRSLQKEKLLSIGLSENHANQLLAIVELSKRIAGVKLKTGDAINSPQNAATALSLIAYEEKESFALLCLDVKNKLICSPVVVSIGTATSTPGSTRETFRVALLKNATQIIIGHNHPSGDPDPSPNDIGVTKRFLESGSNLGISVLDHIIVARDRHASIRELRPHLWEEIPQAID